MARRRRGIDIVPLLGIGAVYLVATGKIQLPGLSLGDGGSLIPLGPRDQAIEAAKTHLRQFIGSDITIVVQSVEDIVFPDTSLGCDTTGIPAAVLIQGYKITLVANGRIWTYAADQKGRVCLLEHV